jgi:hypothetical protein
MHLGFRGQIASARTAVEPDTSALTTVDICVDGAMTLAAIRKTYPRGRFMLPSTVLGTFKIVTDLVNQLYPVDLLLKE